jgi:predicted DNA-binding protein
VEDTIERVQSNLRLDTETKRRLRVIAADEGRNQSDVVADAVQLYAEGVLALVRSQQPCGHRSQS